MPESTGNIVGIRASGTLHESDYTVLLPLLEQRFRDHGKLRILFYADADFKGWDIKGAWQDASFGFSHAADFERMALVGAPDWVVWCIKLSAFLIKGEVRIFAADELDAAWDWIKR
ncbi:MAG: STAS/SEC14 domain-containing protein [Rhodobacteraceae bacterium]|nr:STAS/SEC14 domain-containing protein [Paracoccaceae bacterium]